MNLYVPQNYYAYDVIKAPRPQDKIYEFKNNFEEANDAHTQTDYRESEAQTGQWIPPYKILQSKTPEALTLACLSFHNGLLVTKRDIELLLRLRKRREWERYLEDVYSPDNAEYRLKIITELEQNEWEYREKEIEQINELRLELANQQMLEQRMIVQERMNYRINRARERYQTEKSIQLPKIAAECNRALRRAHQRPIGHKFKKLNIIEKFTLLSSNLNAPLSRYGKNPIEIHEKLCVNPQPKSLGDMCSSLWKGILSPPLPQIHAKHIKKHCCKTKHKFCEKFEEPPVYIIKSFDKLRKNVEKIMAGPLPCALGENSEEEEEFLRNIVLLQSIIKGRAVQSMTLRHLKSHRDLVRELKSTVGLQPRDRKKKMKARKDILEGIRDFNIAMQKKGKTIGLIEKLEGHTIATMLDHTSKALVCLEEEKRTHFLALMAEKERWAREAAEGGRRQQEEIRQRQHEEIYKQVLKIQEIGSDLLLKKILNQQLKFTSDALATMWAEKDTKEMDKVVDMSQLEEFDRMEQLTKLTSQFFMDEVEKNFIREQLKARTAVLRKDAEKKIYQPQDKLEVGESPSSDGALSSINEKFGREEDVESRDWDKFYDDIVYNTPEVKYLMAGKVDKIPLYEDPTLVKNLMEEEEEGELQNTKTDEPLKEEEEEESQNIEEESHKEYSQKDSISEESSESLITPTLPEKKKDSDTTCEKYEVQDNSLYDIMDQQDVQYAKMFLSGPESSDDSALEMYEESTEKERRKITTPEREAAEKRRKKCEEQERKYYFKKMAQKILDHIMARANAIADKIQEVSKDTENIPFNEACADALMQAYKIVSKALIKCSADLSNDCLRESLEPWLDTVLSEAEKRVFELFETLEKKKKENKLKATPADETEETEENETEEAKIPIEDITALSQERISVISGVDPEVHRFSAELYECPEIKYDDVISEKSSSGKSKGVMFTDEELKHLWYEGILLEKKLTYLPNESFERPPAVIKTRRPPYDPYCEVLERPKDENINDSEETYYDASSEESNSFER